MNIPKKTKTIDWTTKLSPLVHQLLSVRGINKGSMLVINTMKNATNGSVQTRKATSTLVHLIKAVDTDNKFHIVKIDQLNAARRMLGLSVDDSLESRGKAIELARYLSAQYLLYSVIFGDIKNPKLNLQLMLVQSGEIVWYCNNVLLDQ
ncbi:penicillin-binding protein activator LpoB [Sodalis sp. CWE]|uniref:penicillin-binding protein activator LpoB n=1 Tax=Sodalis sp. CWE TaxID=2803816 RepID=UPI002104CC82|nr:penicillin-binding protein activator LpoB [Sodalis sp. CWE]